WNKVADLYQEHFMDLDLYNDTYDTFCKSVTRNATILEIGCGPGNITKYILDKRPDFELLGIDVAPNMIDLARKNNSEAEFKVMDCRELDTISGKFDAILCGFCLPYLSKEDSTKLIKDSFDLLQNEGKIYLSVLEGDYEKSGFQSGSTGDKTYFYYYGEAFLISELKRNGFYDFEIVRKVYPRGKESEVHLIIMGRKKHKTSL
ncbi:MAG: SAM-dependent methyltransferase, partial [Saprospiraceae bacterium]